jgi:hypothetical protein
MIYKNLLFFHIPKAGGSSIEKKFMGKHSFLDFTIKTIFVDSKFSKRLISGLRKRLWRKIVFYLVGLFFYDEKFLWGVKHGKVLQHLTYLELIQMGYLNRFQMNAFIKFCIVRNPYDRIISAYHFMGGNSSFKEFIQYVYREIDKYYRKNKDPFVILLPQYEFIVDETGKSQMDEIIYFENLKEEFPAFCRKYKLDLGELPHINARKRNKSAIKEYYNQETADMIYKLYKRDFKMFGYHRLLFKRKKIEKEQNDDIEDNI